LYLCDYLITFFLVPSPSIYILGDDRINMNVHPEEDVSILAEHGD